MDGSEPSGGRLCDGLIAGSRSVFTPDFTRVPTRLSIWACRDRKDNVMVDLTERTPKSDVDDPACGLVNKRGVLTVIVNVVRGVVQTNRTADAEMNEDVGEVMEA